MGWITAEFYAAPPGIRYPRNSLGGLIWRDIIEKIVANVPRPLSFGHEISKVAALDRQERPRWIKEEDEAIGPLVRA